MSFWKTSSASYGTVVGWTEPPDLGDEVHHFGWNAGRSALTTKRVRRWGTTSPPRPRGW